MFTTELKFAGACLLKWFNKKKNKSKNLELSNEKKKENIKLNFGNGFM